MRGIMVGLKTGGKQVAVVVIKLPTCAATLLMEEHNSILFPFQGSFCIWVVSGSPADFQAKLPRTFQVAIKV